MSCVWEIPLMSLWKRVGFTTVSGEDLLRQRHLIQPFWKKESGHNWNMVSEWALWTAPLLGAHPCRQTAGKNCRQLLATNWELYSSDFDRKQASFEWEIHFSCGGKRAIRSCEWALSFVWKHFRDFPTCQFLGVGISVQLGVKTLQTFKLVGLFNLARQKRVDQSTEHFMAVLHSWRAQVSHPAKLVRQKREKNRKATRFIVMGISKGRERHLPCIEYICPSMFITTMYNNNGKCLMSHELHNCSEWTWAWSWWHSTTVWAPECTCIMLQILQCNSKHFHCWKITASKANNTTTTRKQCCVDKNRSSNSRTLCKCRLIVNNSRIFLFYRCFQTNLFNCLGILCQQEKQHADSGDSHWKILPLTSETLAKQKSLQPCWKGRLQNFLDSSFDASWQQTAAWLRSQNSRVFPQLFGLREIFCKNLASKKETKTDAPQEEPSSPLQIIQCAFVWTARVVSDPSTRLAMEQVRDLMRSTRHDNASGRNYFWQHAVPELRSAAI